MDDEDVIDDEEILKAIVDESKAKTLVKMEEGLKAYLKIMGKKATFKGWVAHDYPENVTLDSRLTIPYNDWLLVWDNITSKKRGLFGSLLTARGNKTRRKLVRKKSLSKKRGHRKYRKQSRKPRKVRKVRKLGKSRK